MYQQTSLFFYRFRLVFAAVFTLAFLMLISALVTTIGSGTILAHPSTSTLGMGTYDSTNTVTDGAYVLGADAQRALLATGSTIYSSCRSITLMTDRTGKSIAHGGSVAASAAWGGVRTGATMAAHGVGNSVIATMRFALFTLSLPGKGVALVFSGSGHRVNALIKPTADKAAPVISNETSAAILAKFNAVQQKEIAKLQAAQLVANRELDGTIVAGDPNHGGYPARWDNVSQDSTLDNWGMYNRECVSYAAWKVYQTFGHMPYWGGVGNANEWPADARGAGIPTSSIPRVHSVAISMNGYYGHAMWVEKVSGNMIYVSQYNYDLYGHYSEMWVNGSNFTYIYFK